MSKRIPVTELSEIERIDRIEFDLVTMMVMSVDLSTRQMKAILLDIFHRRAENCGPDPSDDELTILFNNAWTIIDRVHTLSKIVNPKLKSTSNVSEFLSHSARASRLRNKMDHVHGQISNLASKTRKATPPILGVLTAAMLTREQIDQGFVHSVQGIVLSHSEFHHKQHLQSFPDEIFPIKGPIDHIRLHAFDEVIDLSKLSRSTIQLTNVLKLREDDLPNTDRRYRVFVDVKLGRPEMI
jgi:hypothetical protein